jgi:hypothetical protein
MSQIAEMKPRAADLLAQMGPNVYRAAYDRGMSLSAYLELYEDPSDGYQDGLDAFGRVVKAADIRVVSRPEIGLYASEYGDFMKDEHTRALVPEWIARQWRRAQTGRPFSTRALLLSSDGVLGGWERPYAEAMSPRWDVNIAPAIPLSELVAITTPIDSDSYRAFYLTNTTADNRLVRVAEGAELPRVKLVGGDQTIDLYKYGRALEATYEQLRRQKIDKLGLFIQRMAVQAEMDKVATVIDVAVNGDGNSNAATNYNLTTLDTGATAGTMTLKGWLAFKMKFANPYIMTVVLSQEADALSLLTLSAGNANTPLVFVAGASGFGGFRQINPNLDGTVGLGWTSDAPANKLVGMDSRFAIERVIEIGANISEIERFVTRQTQVLTMTEVEGYAVLDENATKTMTINA